MSPSWGRYRISWPIGVRDGERAGRAKERKAYFYMLGQMWKSMPAATFAALIKGVFPGITPFLIVWLTGRLIDAVLAGAPADEMRRLALIGAAGVMVLGLFYGVFEKLINEKLEFAFERQQGPIAEKSMRMDFAYLEDAEVHRMAEEVNSFFPRFGLFGMVLDAMLHVADSAVLIVCACVLVLPQLMAAGRSAVPVLSAPLFGIGFFLLIVALNWANTVQRVRAGAKMEEMYSAERNPLESRRRFFMGLYAGAETQKDLRMCGQGRLMRDELERMRDKDERFRKRFLRIFLVRSGVADLISGFSTLLVFLFAALCGYFGIISAGGVVVFVTSIRKVTDSLFALSQALGECKEVSLVAVKYMDYMNLHQRRHEGTIPVEKRRDDRFRVDFEHVSFRYPGAKEDVLHDLNLSFVIGEKMAIVGRNGSGKSTFIKLLCRLYDVTEGVIKVNGIDIRKYDYQEYCDLFGVVFQDFTMFDFGLGESIACAEQFDEAHVWDALGRAGLKERADRLATGLHTCIGTGFREDGVNFSGGEKQKLAIARAIYKDAPFVILDEPTAALDPEAENEVFAGFDRMVGRKTALYISHRLASCRFCEDILVFDKGQVVQRGSHEELEAAEGLYRDLWNAQAQYYA